MDQTNDGRSKPCVFLWPIWFYNPLLNDSTRNPDADQQHGKQNQQRDQPPQMTMGFRGLVMPMHVPRNLKIVRMSEYRIPPFSRSQETFTSIDLGFAFSDLGRCTFKTPSL